MKSNSQVKRVYPCLWETLEKMRIKETVENGRIVDMSKIQEKAANILKIELNNQNQKKKKLRVEWDFDFKI